MFELGWLQVSVNAGAEGSHQIITEIPGWLWALLQDLPPPSGNAADASSGNPGIAMGGLAVVSPLSHL